MKFQPKASHFIDGDYVEDTAGTPIEVIYPATGEVIAQLHSATSGSLKEPCLRLRRRKRPGPQ